MEFEVLDEHEQGELVQKCCARTQCRSRSAFALGLVLIFGWQQWKAHRAHHAGEAAMQYQALIGALDAKRVDDAKAIADVLRKDFSDTAYATFAAMRAAEIANDKGDLKDATTNLEWAQEHAGAAALKTLAGINLAKVKLAQGDADAALKLVDGLPKTDYTALRGDLRGDILAQLGRNDDARAAYQDALSHLDAQAPNRAFVQMKLDNLATAPIAQAASKEASGS